MNSDPAVVLVVDDNETNRDLLGRRLQRQGLQTLMAEDGLKALALLQTQAVDLVLLDIMMPGMNGYEVLGQLKADPRLRHIPVIMVSAIDDLDSIVRCIEMGAEDYLPKPFNPVLLKARIGASLEKKRLRDQEQAYLKQLQAEQEKSERLLLSILPKTIADRLKQSTGTIADSFAEATVLFADIVDFTRISASLSPTELVNLLNTIFSEFDQLAEQYELEKIKTIGDAYMVVGGLPTPRTDHAQAIAEMALDMQKAISQFQLPGQAPLQMRIGISSGPVEAGVIGTKKFIYDLWGDTVNMASRMESQGVAGLIQITEMTYKLLHHQFLCQERGVVDIKGKGEMLTYFLMGRDRL